MNLEKINPKDHSLFEVVPLSEEYFVQIGDRWRNASILLKKENKEWQLVDKNNKILGNNIKHFGLGSGICIERLKEEERKKIEENEKTTYAVY